MSVDTLLPLSLTCKVHSPSIGKLSVLKLEVKIRSTVSGHPFRRKR